VFDRCNDRVVAGQNSSLGDVNAREGAGNSGIRKECRPGGQDSSCGAEARASPCLHIEKSHALPAYYGAAFCKFRWRINRIRRRHAEISQSCTLTVDRVPARA
jgi:hypothetical protein